MRLGFRGGSRCPFAVGELHGLERDVDRVIRERGVPLPRQRQEQPSDGRCRLTRLLVGHAMDGDDGYPVGLIGSIDHEGGACG